MIDAADLRRIENVDGVARLLEQLGYSVGVIPIDEELWRGSHLLPSTAGRVRVVQLVEEDTLHIYLVEGSRADAADLVTRLQRWNVMLKCVCLHLDPSARRLSILDRTGDRQRRLDVELDSPSGGSLDRLALLRRDRELDPAASFDLALDRDQIARKFFSRFRDAVSDVTRILISECAGEGESSCSSQALLLMSRLLFLHFIQQKGWLDHERGYLTRAIRRVLDDGGLVYRQLFVPLFFACLNTPAAQRSRAAENLGTIPYLNGGLFQPSAFEQKHPGAVIPNEVICRIIDDVFGYFAFSVDESDVDGAHIDPEMLGKVFESLMEGSERSRSGSFYTPRVIVEPMVATALRDWLADGDGETRQLLSEASEIDRTRARALLARLHSVTVLDPACGSGAFLLAALYEIERMTEMISRRSGISDSPDLRQQIVTRCLYGVDVKSEAIRLCELRLWLSIVAPSHREIDHVPPLPNLDRNVLQGNSLIGPLDFLGSDRRSLYGEWSSSLRTESELIERYRTGTREEKPALLHRIRTNDVKIAVSLLSKSIERDRLDIEILSNDPNGALFEARRIASRADTSERLRLERRLEDSRRALDRLRSGDLDFFAYEIHFAHMVQRGGFDLILGNPPWVRASRIPERTRQIYADRYRIARPRIRVTRQPFEQPDLSIFFLERAIDLAREGGVIALLLPAKFLTANYAAAMRREIGERHQVVELSDWSDRAKELFDADTFPLAVTLRKGRRSEGTIEIAREGEAFSIPQRSLVPNSYSEPWSLAAPELASLLQTLAKRFPPLHAQLSRRPLMGVKTGANARFFFENVKVSGSRAHLADLDLEIPLRALCRAVRGRDVRRWKATEGVWMLWPPVEGWRRTPAWVRELCKRYQIEGSELRLSYVRPEHLGIKVVWKDVSRGLQSVVLPSSVHIESVELPLVPNQTLYLLDATSIEESYWLSAVLNSSLFGALALMIADRAKDCHYRYYGSTLARLPLPPFDHRVEASARLVRLSRRAHQGESLEQQIDELVALEFGLGDDELALCKRTIEARLGSR